MVTDSRGLVERLEHRVRIFLDHAQIGFRRAIRSAGPLLPVAKCSQCDLELLRERSLGGAHLLANLARVRHAAHAGQLLVSERRIVRIRKGILINLFLSHRLQAGPLGFRHQR